MDGLSASVAAGVLSVTINRPEHLNALTVPVLATLADVLEAAASDPQVKVVRLGGAGRAFSAGASMNVDDWHGVGAAIDVTVQANRAVRAITTMPQPVVAVVQGPVAGNGVSLALACDLVVASDRAFFTMGATKVGLMPDAGASALLAATVGRARAMQMVLLNERLTAAQVLAWGLIAAVCPQQDLEAEASRIIALLLSGPAPVFAKTKRAINAVALADLEPAFERELTGQAELLGTNDFVEGATAFLQRRPAVFTGT
ncbi:enoyl-CoA hydratase [Mycobacterium asiaticum]|uniref:Enoyl-CoA hydratase n=1 Tax=Mycobacterium asiaticum TaxID=1790 RepID=A0A1A3KRA2_MYCAS|nr:enoyl-CoA hydratase [Mycobacterium asiaticum]OBJ86481.1 enoyl-CoA hydratase [Mycobacterium asiaticum]